MMDWKVVTAELEKKLDPRHVKPPPQGKRGEYIEGWHAIAEANRIFGHGGWSYDISSISLTNASSDAGKHRVGYMAHVVVTVDGVERGDVGHGQGFGKSEGDAHDSAVKEAVTDGLKRALRSFGNPFGLALYDKSKANVGVDAPPFDPDDTTARLTKALQGAETHDKLEGIWNHKATQAAYAKLANGHRTTVMDAFNDRKATLGAQLTNQGAG